MRLELIREVITCILILSTGFISVVEAQESRFNTLESVSVIASHSHGFGGCVGPLKINKTGITFSGIQMIKGSDGRERDFGHSFSILYTEMESCQFVENTDGRETGLSKWPWLKISYIRKDGEVKEISFVFNGGNKVDKSAGLADFFTARQAYNAYCKSKNE